MRILKERKVMRMGKVVALAVCVLVGAFAVLVVLLNAVMNGLPVDDDILNHVVAMRMHRSRVHAFIGVKPSSSTREEDFYSSSWQWRSVHLYYDSNNQARGWEAYAAG